LLLRVAAFAVSLLLATVVVGSWTASPAQSGPNCSVDASIDSEEYLLLGYINQHRAQNGVGPLQLSDTLNRGAAWKSQHMADEGYFAHDDTPIGRSWIQRLRDCDYTYNTWLGENLAAGNAGAEATFEQWRDSPGHNVNMLNGDYAAIGIGRAFGSGSPYGWYWTTDFGGVADGYTAPPPPPSPSPTASPTNTPAATPTPTATPPPAPTPTPVGPDTDGDGCGDGVEAGDNPGLGGGRDPANPWDFFDTPNGNNQRDSQITGEDLFRVLARFGATDNGGTASINRNSDPLSPPPPAGYHPAFDRGQVLGPQAWNRGPADGAIAAGDVFAIISQFGHTCG
jgi:uncharacterized protein YkwD